MSPRQGSHCNIHSYNAVSLHARTQGLPQNGSVDSLPSSTESSSLQTFLCLHSQIWLLGRDLYSKFLKGLMERSWDSRELHPIPRASKNEVGGIIVTNRSNEKLREEKSIILVQGSEDCSLESGNQLYCVWWHTCARACLCVCVYVCAFVQCLCV